MCIRDRKDGIRVIAVSFWPQGPMLADQALEIYEGAGKVYGCLLYTSLQKPVKFLVGRV